MTAATPDSGARRASQARWLLLFFAVALGTCLALDGAARNRALERWMTAQSSALSVRNGMLFSDNGSFIDYEERMLLDEIPATDFTHGGLFFFGTSNTKWAFTTWDLPQDLKARLHDFGTGAASHQTVLRLVRFAGEKGMFAAAERSKVFLGVSYHLGKTETRGGYFPALVRRQGVYQIGDDDRLSEAPLAPVERWFRIEKARSGGLVRNAARLIKNWALASLGRSHQPPHDAARYQQDWREYMGPDWQGNIDRELGHLAQTLDLLHERGVPVELILLPQGTWMEGLPFPAYYNSRVLALARRTGTPVLDWSKTMPDADFIDSNHLTVTGQTRFRNMILQHEQARLQPGPAAPSAP